MVLLRRMCWLTGLGLFITMSGVAVGQSDDLCFMRTSSGQQISLGKLCRKPADKNMDDIVWDENNYDPRYVTREGDGAWTVTVGAPRPFRFPGGSVLWPDGRTTYPVGYTSKTIVKDGEVAGIQYYQPDGITPLSPGEVLRLPTGQEITQEKF
jgi:hypothetical protein